MEVATSNVYYFKQEEKEGFNGFAEDKVKQCLEGLAYQYIISSLKGEYRIDIKNIIEETKFISLEGFVDAIKLTGVKCNGNRKEIENVKIMKKIKKAFENIVLNNQDNIELNFFKLREFIEKEKGFLRNN